MRILSLPARIAAISSLFVAGTTAAIGCQDDPGVVVIGLTSELRPNVDFVTLEAEILVGGEVVRTESFSEATLGFPLELAIEEIEDETPVEVRLTASAPGTTVLSRVVSTKAVSGRTLLAEVPLEAACAFGAAPACEDGQTCVAGQCADPFVDPSELPEYDPDWGNVTGGDACDGPGGPTVLVGEGQADYLPLADQQVLQVEAGPQGGYHVWMAARVRNLAQTGSVTVVKGRIDALDYDVPPFSVVFTLEPDEGSYCKIFGLRFRLDSDGFPIESVLGEELEVTVELNDPDGTVGTGSARVILSDTIL